MYTYIHIYICIYIHTHTRPKNLKARIQTESLYTPMFMAALFTIAKSEKHLKGLSVEEWINRMWFV